jgi:hypothetical protein
MVILSTPDIPIDVKSIKAEDYTTLLFGQMAIESIHEIAKLYRLVIDSDCNGVYKIE